MRVEVIGDATLYCGDCRDVLPLIPAASVDMVWTDPPYGNSNHDGDLNAVLNKYRGLQSMPIANDDQESMRSIVDYTLTEAARLLKRASSCCLCCSGGGGGNGPAFAWLANRMDAEGLCFFHAVIWDKANPGLGWRFRRQYEMVMIAHRAGGEILWPNERAVPNVYRLLPPRERQHPNEKPQALVEWFLDNQTAPGQLVLDPFMGSGTTGVACANLGRKFAGVEIEPRYFDIACRRIEEAFKQPRLFAEPPLVWVQPSLLEAL